MGIPFASQFEGLADGCYWVSSIGYTENDLRSTYAPRMRRMNEMLSGGWKRVLNRLALIRSGEVDDVREGNAKVEVKCAKSATVKEKQTWFD